LTAFCPGVSFLFLLPIFLDEVDYGLSSPFQQAIPIKTQKGENGIIISQAITATRASK